MPVLDTEKLIANRVQAIQNYHAACGIKRAELDVSGGVDSAVMLGLLVRAVGADNITAVYSSIHSSEDSYNRAKEVCDAFGVPLININLNGTFDKLITRMMDSMLDAGYDLEEVRDRCNADGTILGSIRSCLRAPIGRGFNRMLGGGVRHGTGNECEDRWLRFYQKGGDGEVDTNPIAMLSKGEVFQLGRALGVPKSILEAKPSPDLQGVGEAHNDEDELKALTGVDWTYSKVNPDTGEYTFVGSIEKMSRAMDTVKYVAKGGTEEACIGVLKSMHSAPNPDDTLVNFFGEDKFVVLKMLYSAEKLESRTRHKLNPNCPALGDRDELIKEGILTNELPKV